MNIGRIRRSFILLALAGAGCTATTDADHPAVHGRRVQSATVATEGAGQYRVGTYELVFTPIADSVAHARRAALVVDLAAGRGLVRGFVEWGRSGEAPLTYVVGGWAQQQQVGGAPVTVFDLGLKYLEGPGPRQGAPLREHSTALAVRVVVDEASGEATLRRRQ
jgi:hypothetical protein